MDAIVWRYFVWKAKIHAIKGIQRDKEFKTRIKLPPGIKLFETKEEALQSLLPRLKRLREGFLMHAKKLEKEIESIEAKVSEVQTSLEDEEKKN